MLISKDVLMACGSREKETEVQWQKILCFQTDVEKLS